MAEEVERLLETGADITLCDCSQKTALHVSPPELQGKVLGWMSRPHLPPQARLLQASWQGDLLSLQHLLAQTGRLDVNAPNSDGGTAVMLAVRGVDLFQSIATPLPWDHRPVEVVKELLGFSADLQLRDHSGCSALHYAANITSPLREELIHVMVEALSCTDAAPVSPLALDQHSCQDLDSEFEDSDIEVDIESLYSNRSTATSPTQTHRHQHLLYTHTGEELESPGIPPLSDHHKDLSQADKGIPFCFQNAMETLRDTRQAYQDAGRGNSLCIHSSLSLGYSPQQPPFHRQQRSVLSGYTCRPVRRHLSLCPEDNLFYPNRGGLSLPSLSDNSRHWGHVDPAPSCGLLSTRTPCVPVSPRHRQRTRSVVAPCPSVPSLLSVAEPSQLSQSAPSIMEPLLCSSAMLQARAHIQTRLGSQDTVNEHKFSHGLLPAPHPRTPKLLAPLNSRPRNSAALPTLKHHVPLKPINRTPLCSRTRPKRDRFSWGSPRAAPLTIAKGGSEESGWSSTSSQSSIDLEDDESDIEDRASEDRNLKFIGNRLVQHLEDLDSTEADLVGEIGQHFKLQSSVSQNPLIHRSAHNLDGQPFNDDPISPENNVNSHCEGNATNMNYLKEPVNNQTFTKCDYAKQSDTVNRVKNTVNIETPAASDSKEKNDVGSTTDPGTDITHVIIFGMNDDQKDTSACPERNHRNDLQSVQQTEEMKDPFDGGVQGDSPGLHRPEKAKLNANTDVGKTQLFNAPVNLPFSVMDASKDKMLLKASNPAKNKERRTSMNCELRANNQTNKSSPFNLLLHQDLSTRKKSKNNLKYSSLSAQVKDKTRKSPELIINGEATVSKVKSKIKSGKGAHRSPDTPSPRKKVIDHPQSKRTNPDKSNCSRAQPPVRELKSARQVKRLSVTGAPRSKSAVDVITYKDMFKQIQSRDEGPAIYEMFAGPVYDDLRVSSSCEKTKDRQVQSAASRQVQQPHKVKHRALKQPQCKVRRSPAESTVLSTKSKTRHASSRAKPHFTPLSRKGSCTRDNMPKQETKVVHVGALEEGEDHILSTIEEAVSRHESETLKTDDTTLTAPTNIPQAKDSHNMLMKVKSSKESRPVPEPVLPHNSPQAKINTWTSSSSSSHGVMSPVYQTFLDEVGDGPLTDDLLQCLAEELISLDERDTSVGLYPENQESRHKESKREGDPESGTNMSPEVIPTGGAALLGSGVTVGDTIIWTKGEMLGRGAYGTVYCGLTSQGQLIAVKQVGLDASDPDAAKREYSRLQGEVELLKTLSHTNIVGFLGTSLYQHVVSIFMEYIPGGSIASILHRFGPLPERVLALYTRQMLEGVAYLHLNRVIHRDLKGNNVMLMPTGVIKLIDFGCARRLSCLNHTSTSGELLKSVHGTPYWMAPEVINETGYGRRSDIWSVGCTVFEMATGKPPLAHMDKIAALFYIGAQRGLMPTLPDRFTDNARDFVKICLTSDQRLRPSADQLLKHPFIPDTETGANHWEAQRKNCCGHTQGQCG